MYSGNKIGLLSSLLGCYATFDKLWFEGLKNKLSKCYQNNILTYLHHIHPRDCLQSKKGQIFYPEGVKTGRAAG